MKNTSRILRNVGITFSDSDLKILRQFETIYSEITIAEIRNKGASPRRYVIKICKSKGSPETQKEFQNLSLFNARFGNGRIQVPQPVGVDTDSNAIVMMFVQGTNLKDLLIGIRRQKDYHLAEIIELAADGLSKFHKMSEVHEIEDIVVRSPYLDKNLAIDEIKNIIGKCGLQSITKSFIDFSVWNILVNRNGETMMTLIDFPDNDCILPAHVDLARFRYSLRVISHRPAMRIPGIAWWEVQSVYDQFLERYNLNMKTMMNEYDFSLIRLFEREYAKKIMQVYESDKSSIKMIIEGKYMRKLLDKMISEG